MRTNYNKELANIFVFFLEFLGIFQKIQTKIDFNLIFWEH
jgi:hypothetical protein